MDDRCAILLTTIHSCCEHVLVIDFQTTPTVWNNVYLSHKKLDLVKNAKAGNYPKPDKRIKECGTNRREGGGSDKQKAIFCQHRSSFTGKVQVKVLNTCYSWDQHISLQSQIPVLKHVIIFTAARSSEKNGELHRKEQGPRQINCDRAVKKNTLIGRN